MSRMRRFAIAVSTVSLLSLGTALTAALAAPAGGVKGDPQPELVPFKIGAASSSGSVAIESNGSIVTAYDISSAKLVVCVLARGGHKCSHKTTITTHGDANTLFNTWQRIAGSFGIGLVVALYATQARTEGPVAALHAAGLVLVAIALTGARSARCSCPRSVTQRWREASATRADGAARPRAWPDR